MIRSSRPDDHAWIRDTAALVYSELGDYGTIIPSWLDHPGVLAFVEVDDAGSRRGFILVGFYTPEGARGRECIADLLAIGVAPEHQRCGIGSQLLAYAVEVARAAATRQRVPEIRLTVADTNLGARALFERAGFRILTEDYGNYDGGQRALRMSRALRD